MDFSNAKMKAARVDPLEKYMLDTRFVKKFRSFLDSDNTELYSAEGLPSIGRKAWHIMAERNNLHSVSAGEGACRHVVVSKRPFVADGKPLLLSSTLQKRFREDFGLKINLCDYNDFEYYIDLYDARPKLNTMLAAIAEFPNEFAFMTYLIDVKKRIWKHLKEAKGYKRFIYKDLEPFSKAIAATRNKLNLHNSYLKPENDGKHYISIDIRSANYNAMYWFDKTLFIVDGVQTTTWQEFVGKFAEGHPAVTVYIQSSKLFRQKIFWEFNHKRQAILWEYMITHVADRLDFGDNQPINAYHISDELVFETHNYDAFKALNLDPEIYKVQNFTLYHVAKGTSWMLKSYRSGNLPEENVQDIKCCNPTEYTLVWKHMRDMDIEQRDLKARWNQETGNWDYTDWNVNWNYESYSDPNE